MQWTPAPTATRLRQIALVAEDLERATYLLTYVMGTEVIYVDPRVAIWGLRNVLVAIGGDVIEVVSPMTRNTTAGRLLTKRGDGGYMIIMQTTDAKARQSYLSSSGLAKTIFEHESDEAVCIQYHPKGVKGGMIPELDSHQSTSTNPTPMASAFSPWHACGPDYGSYAAAMKRRSHLHFVEAVCRLAPGDGDVHAAARQWEELFGVPRRGGELLFTNMRMRFLGGEEGGREGLEEITVGVEGEVEYMEILKRARKEGLLDGDDGTVNMLGVKWHFVVIDRTVGEGRESKI